MYNKSFSAFVLCSNAFCFGAISDQDYQRQLDEAHQNRTQVENQIQDTEIQRGALERRRVEQERLRGELDRQRQQELRRRDAERR